MGQHWRMMRVPEYVFQKLENEQELMTAAYGCGQIELPDEYAERIPLHYVIQALIKFKNEHRERASEQRAKKRRGRPPKPKGPHVRPESSSEGHVYMPNRETTERPEDGDKAVEQLIDALDVRDCGED